MSENDLVVSLDDKLIAMDTRIQSLEEMNCYLTVRLTAVEKVLTAFKMMKV